jgi:hypothetical protein
MKLKICFLLALVSAMLMLNANSEYFVTVNPVTGTFANINVIPGVSLISVGNTSCTALDKIGNRFFFCGNDSQGLYHLYTLDAATGNILHEPLFSPDLNGNGSIGQLVFDDSTGILYGLSISTVTNTVSFVSVNEITGAITNISSFTGINSILVANYAYNQTQHIYFFVAADTAGNNYLYSVRATDGSIISRPVLTANNLFTLMRFDNTTQTLFGQKSGQVVTVNTTTGANTLLVNIPQAAGIPLIPNCATFDEGRQRLICGGTDGLGILRLFSVDVSTGAIVSDPIFPAGISSPDNVIELIYDNTSDTLYALHWGSLPAGINSLSDGQDINVYPNPLTNGNWQLVAGSNLLGSSVELFDVTGRLVYKSEIRSVNSDIDARLAPGSYMLRLQSPTDNYTLKLLKLQ